MNFIKQLKMKKIVTTLVFLMICIFNILTAQTTESKQLNPTIAAIKDKQKIKLKEDLKLNDYQAEEVATIQMEFMPKLRGLRGLQKEDRLLKIKEINDAYKAKLTAVLKDDKLVEKVIEHQEAERKSRMERVKNGE